MNEFLVIFGCGENYSMSNILKWLVPNQINKNYNMEIIKAFQKFGYLVCGDLFVRIYKVQYPSELDEGLIKKYLTFYVDPMGWGNEYCIFKWKDYIINLLEHEKIPLQEIRKQLDLVKQIKTNHHVEILKVTDETLKLIDLYHEQKCKKTFQKYYEVPRKPSEYICDCGSLQFSINKKT